MGSGTPHPVVEEVKLENIRESSAENLECFDNSAVELEAEPSSTDCNHSASSGEYELEGRRSPLVIPTSPPPPSTNPFDAAPLTPSSEIRQRKFSESTLNRAQSASKLAEGGLLDLDGSQPPLPTETRLWSSSETGFSGTAAAQPFAELALSADVPGTALNNLSSVVGENPFDAVPISSNFPPAPKRDLRSRQVSETHPDLDELLASLAPCDPDDADEAHGKARSRDRQHNRSVSEGFITECEDPVTMMAMDKEPSSLDPLLSDDDGSGAE